MKQASSRWSKRSARYVKARSRADADYQAQADMLAAMTEEQAAAYVRRSKREAPTWEH